MLQLYTTVIGSVFGRNTIRSCSGCRPTQQSRGQIPEGVDLREHRSVLVQGEPTHELLEEVRAFVSTGGNAAFLKPECSPSTESPTNDHLQFSFGISCVITAPFRIRGRGDQFAPLWQDLVMDGDYDSRVDFRPGPSEEFNCVANVKTEGKTVCTALKGTIGAGRVLFIADTRGLIIFSDAGYQRGDHAEAASRLLNWLVEEPSARALPSENSFDSPVASTRPPWWHASSQQTLFEGVHESGSARGDTAGPRGRHAHVPPQLRPVPADERHPHKLFVPLVRPQLDTDDAHLPGACAGPVLESGDGAEFEHMGVTICLVCADERV